MADKKQYSDDQDIREDEGQKGGRSTGMEEEDEKTGLQDEPEEMGSLE